MAISECIILITFELSCTRLIENCDKNKCFSLFTIVSGCEMSQTTWSSSIAEPYYCHIISFRILVALII